MQKLPKEYWKISFVNAEQEDEWDIAYKKLEAGYRWQVDSALHYMVYYKQPWKNYPNIICDECMERLYLIDVSHKGIGTKTVQMMVYFSNPIGRITPVYCEAKK